MSNRHDDQIDRLLGVLHRRVETGPSAECLDPETLAAWMDGRLGGVALARAEAHASTCARCQSIMGAMARTSGAELDEDRGGGASAQSRFRRVLPWAAPLTAAATAAALYIAVRPAPSPAPNEFRTGATRQVAPESEAASSVRSEADASDAPRQSAKSTDERAPQGQASAPAGQPGSAAATLPSPALEQKQEFVARDAAETRPAGKVGTSPPPPPAPLPERRELKDVMKSGEPAALPRVPEDPRAARPATPPSPAAPVTSGYVRSRAAASAARPGALEESVSISLEIRTPDPAVRWRIAAPTVVEKSRDGGKTWIAQDVGIPMTLSAGAAPSADVCWLVGREGAIVRTTDARTWRRVVFPERVDLIGIHATSADAATVTAADGRTFVTVDAGKTWRAGR